MLHVAYRPAALDWIGYQAWPFKGFSPEWHKFVAQASVRQLTVLGFPSPGIRTGRTRRWRGWPLATRAWT